MDTQEVKEPEKNKEPQTSSEKKEKPDSEQITTTTKQTVPKNPGRIAAGKKLAEHNKKAREAKKKAKEVTRTDTKRVEQKENPPTENESEQSSSFSLTQVLSVASIVVSLAGLYYKREELKHLFKNKSNVGRERSEKAQKQLIDHMVEVERKNIEVPHSGTQQAATKKSPKLKQMD